MHIEREAFDPECRALGVQQPWAELIVRGVKSLEVRSQPTRVRGRVAIYASKRPSTLQAAELVVDEFGLNLDTLPKGLLVGTVEVVDCRACRPDDSPAACVPEHLLIDQYAWVLKNPCRIEPRPVRFLPYGVWFYPFRRKSGRGQSGSI